jgi:hypothetical protein
MVKCVDQNLGGSACLAVNDTVNVVLTRRLVPQAGPESLQAKSSPT